MTAIPYASQLIDPKHARAAHWFYRAALVMGILPAAAGVGILLFYWATYAAFWQSAGLILLPVGLGMVMLGLAFLAIWAIIDGRSTRIAQRRFRHAKFWLTLLLLLSNFGVAFGCAAGGFYLVSRTVVEVFNDTGAPIDACTIEFDTARRAALGPIGPGGHVRRVLPDFNKGEIKLQVDQGPHHQEIVAVGYARSPSSPHVRVHIKPGLASDIEQLK